MPAVAGGLSVFDCAGVADGAAAAVVVRAEDAHKYTDKPIYIKALSFVAGDGSTLRLTCSIGFAEYARWRDDAFRDGRGGGAWPQMVELAEQALHWVKQHGRDGWAAFRPSGRSDVATLVKDLQRHGAANLLREQRLELLSSRA